MLAVQALHHPHAGDVLIVLAVDHGNGAPDTHEGMAGKALPIGQDEDQWRDDPQVDQGQLPVGEQHGDDDPSQAEEVCQGRDQQLKGLLQLHDIALTARHDASDRGAVKERRGQGLQMIEQLRAQAIQNTLPDSGNGDELEVIGPEVDEGDAEKNQPHDMQPPQVATIDPPVDPIHDHQGNAHIGRGIHEHGSQGDQGIPSIGDQIGQQAHDHSIVIDLADDCVIAQIVAVGSKHAPRIGAAPTAQDVPATFHLGQPSTPPDLAPSSKISSCGRSCNS